MPDQEIVDLLVCGPFGGIDTRTGTIFADPKTAVELSNCDTHRLEGILATALGRSPFLSFNNVDGPLEVLATYTVGQQRIFYIVQDSAGNIVYYDTKNASYGTLGNLSPFTQAIQSNGILWLNNGQQIFLGPNGLEVATWQYPMPTQAKYNYNASANDGVRNPLAPGIYSYAFVQKIALENVDTTAFQYTTANGDVATGQRNDGSSIFPYAVENQKGNANAILSGIFAGYTSDGYPFTTQVFRYSTNSPTFNFLVELVENTQYIDDASDASIGGNQQIIPNQDPPPTGGSYPPNPIEAHQDRLWTMAIVNNKNTNNLPQTQCLYARPGEPWSFDIINQALLIEDEETTLLAGIPGITGVPFGDFPVALCALGSALMTWRRSTTSLIYGQDESTYQALKIFADLGCVAPLSVIKYNGLVWWLSAQGFYSFDGSSVQWISKAVYNLLQDLGPAAWQTAIGSAKDLTLLWSFPNNDVTLRYYIPTQAWDTLPYTTPSAAYGYSLPSDLSATPLSMNQIAAIRPGEPLVDFWQSGDTDVAGPIVGTFLSQEIDLDHPEWEKSYRFVMIEAPVQSGVTVDITLWINEKIVKTWTGYDLSVGLPTKILPVPADVNNGYTAQLQLVLHNAPNATGPAIIYRAKVGGILKRAWTFRQTQTGSSKHPETQPG
jgi:hypothetical protein